MRNLLLASFVAMSALSPLAASANNAAVESELRSQPDVSDFYQDLVNSGVVAELDEDHSYTIFAPVNEAFSQYPADQFPCFYQPQCAANAANILRNHIVAHTIHVEDAAAHKGGLFSINRRFINVGEPHRNDYAVDGNAIVYSTAFAGGMLYKINGLIAKPNELADMQNATVGVAGERTSTSNSVHTIPDPSCGPQGCPDAASQTTTVTRTVVTPVPVQ